MGVYNLEHRTRFTDVSRVLDLAAADTPTTVGADFIAGKSKHTIYIQRIAVHVRTAAAQAISFVDGAGREIAVLPASAAVGDVHVLLDEPEGVPLTEGEELDITGTAGVEATISITAFRKLTGVITAADFAAVVFALLFLLPAPVAAQATLAEAARIVPVDTVHRPLLIAGIGQAADVATSCWLFRTGDFSEGNHLLPTSCWKLAAIKGGLYVAADVAIHSLERRNPKQAKRFARILAVASWAPVVWNGVQIYRYSKRQLALRTP